MLANPASVIEEVIKFFGRIAGKVVCIFDDLPFLFKSVLPNSIESVGSFMLVGAGLVAFPVEGYEGIKGFRKAYHSSRNAPDRKLKMVGNAAKIVFSVAGLAATAAFLAFSIIGSTILEAATSILIPATLTAITGIELIQKSYQYYLKKIAPHTKNFQADLIKAERKLGFGTTYFSLSFFITAMATISTLTTLGILSGGIAPTAILVGLVVTALSIKIFEIVDKKKGNKFTKAIRKFFHRDHSDEPEIKIAVQNEILSQLQNISVPENTTNISDDQLNQVKKNLQTLLNDASLETQTAVMQNTSDSNTHSPLKASIRKHGIFKKSHHHSNETTDTNEHPDLTIKKRFQ